MRWQYQVSRIAKQRDIQTTIRRAVATADSSRPLRYLKRAIQHDKPHANVSSTNKHSQLHAVRDAAVNRRKPMGKSATPRSRIVKRDGAAAEKIGVLTSRATRIEDISPVGINEPARVISARNIRAHAAIAIAAVTARIVFLGHRPISRNPRRSPTSIPARPAPLVPVC